MDIFQLLTVISSKYPKFQWVLVVLIAAAIIILWKTAETITPKILQGVFTALRKQYRLRKDQAVLERTIRDFTATMQTPNWLSCVRSLSRYHVDVQLDAIYHPLSLKIKDANGATVFARIERLLVQHMAFSIIGPPGSGKSTLLSILAIAYAKDNLEDKFGLKESRLPLFFMLKNLPAALTSLPNIMTDFLRRAGCSVTDDFVENQLKLGRCILFMDGLDETGEETRRREVVNWILKSVAAFPNNRFVVTCRNMEWDLVSVPTMPSVYISELEQDDIDAIIRLWENNYSARVYDQNVLTHGEVSLANHLLKPQNMDLRAIAKNPLLLTIMIILHYNGVKIPTRRVEIYSSFMHILMGEWDDIKNLQSKSYDSNVDKNLKFLQRLCYFVSDRSLSSEAIDITDGEISSYVSKLLSDIFNSKIPPVDFINNIASRSGLLCNISNFKYQFTNRSFYEFLLAKELAETSNYLEITKHINDKDWFEVITLFIGLLPDITPYLHYLDTQSVTKSSQYLRFLARTLTDAVSIDNELRCSIENYLFKLAKSDILSNNIDIALFKDIFNINRVYWRKLFVSILEGHDHIYSPDTIVSVMVQIDDVESLIALDSIASQMTPTVKVLFANALAESALSEAISILWNLADDSEIQPIVIQAMCSKGDKVIESCKEILENENLPIAKQKNAATVLYLLGNPLLIPYLLERMEHGSPQLYSHIFMLLVNKYFAKYSDSNIPEGDILKLLYVNPYTRMVKRMIDAIAALFALILMLPFFPLICLLIKLDSPGPIFVKQLRVGRHERPFAILVFRTMIMTAEESTGAIWAQNNDPRISRIGGFLRKSNLDELPQLINVLIGDMSLVGPRPERPVFVEKLKNIKPHYTLRHFACPGITGLAQVKYVYGASIEDIQNKLEYDLYYITHCSLALDVMILLETVKVVLFGKASR